MADPIKSEDVKSAAPVQAVPVTSQEQAKSVQPTAQAVPPVAASSKPQDAKPEPGQVPLAALQEERTMRQQLQAEMAQLKQQMTQVQTGVQAQPTQPQVDPRKELEQLWESDPRKAVQAEIMYAMDWRDRVDSNLEIQADTLAKKYPDFQNFRGTTMNYVRNLPLNQRGTQGILEAAYYMVRGQNVDSMKQQWETEMMDKYRRGEITAAQLQSPPGSFSAPVQSPGSVNLSDQQIAVARAMHLTPEQYASQIVQRGA